MHSVLVSISILNPVLGFFLFSVRMLCSLGEAFSVESPVSRLHFFLLFLFTGMKFRLSSVSSDRSRPFGTAISVELFGLGRGFRFSHSVCGELLVLVFPVNMFATLGWLCCFLNLSLFGTINHLLISLLSLIHIPSCNSTSCYNSGY